MKAAVRSVTPCFCDTSQSDANASRMMRSSRALISSSVQKKLEKSCTHSK